MFQLLLLREKGPYLPLEQAGPWGRRLRTILGYEKATRLSYLFLPLRQRPYRVCQVPGVVSCGIVSVCGGAGIPKAERAGLG